MASRFVAPGIAALFLATAAGDLPAPTSPGRIPIFAPPDEPEASDFDRTGGGRFSLLPSLEVVVTGYSSTVGQTDSTPFLTASMTRVRPGVIALSRDLIRRYNPSAPFRYGDRVRVEGVGEFVVEDTMHERYEKRADIWFASRREAVRWGKRTLAIFRIAADGVSAGSIGSGGRSASAPSG